MASTYNPSYQTYDQLRSELDEWAGMHPDLMSISSCGRSPEGRDIIAVTLTNLGTGPDDLKPALLVDAGHHAGEVTGGAACMHLVHSLVCGHGQDRRATRILDEFTVYVLPRVSPDGAELYLTSPRYLRSGPRPYPVPWHRPGLRPDDVDGDGRILSMRVADPAGDWRSSTRDERLMVPRGPGEAEPDVVYYRLYAEGVLEDPDGALQVAPPHHGLDFNRNYPGTWAPEIMQKGSGPYPLSEPETRAVAGFVAAHPNIALAVSLHTHGGFILRPPCSEPDTSLPGADLQLLTALGKKGEEITGYRLLSIFGEFTIDSAKPPRGSFIDFLYLTRGIPAFAPELWSLPGRAGVGARTPKEMVKLSPAEAEEDGLKLLTWVDENLGGEGVFPWSPFDHPQLGPVEIGGWDVKQLVQNPPLRLLGDEVGRTSEFMALMAASLPRLVVRDSSATRVGEGLYRIQVEVTNAGFLPTAASEKARSLGMAEPVRAALSLAPGSILVAGDDEQDLGHLPGGRPLGGFLYASSPPDAVARARWLVKMDEPGPVDVEVTSDRAGRIMLSLDPEGGAGR